MISSLGAASSSSSSSSSSSAAVRVEKATSEFLIGPDWTINIDICDTINSNHWLAKDVAKAVKKRLQHKNPKVQLLALTLLETMVKNCGDNVHFQIAERSILQDMVKIVKKKTDMHVRDKVLVLLDSWQEAFGGPGGKYPQYYWAYEELRRAGVEFPKRSFDTAPIFTPPVTHPAPRQPQPGYGMPSNSSTRLDEAMAAEMANLSLSSINSMKEVADLLADMLQAVIPGDRLAVQDEVIVDLVDQCRSNQKKLMQMLTTTGDEELLAQGLELNDNLQMVLAKHDAIASGSPLPTEVPNNNISAREMHDPSLKPAEVKPPTPAADAKPSAPVLAPTAGQIDEEEDEEDDFAQLARRHSKTSPAAQTSEGMVSANNSNSTGESLDPVTSNALILRDPPPTAMPTKEQDIIDLLSLTLSSSIYPETPQNSASANHSTHQEPVASTTQGNPYASQAYLGYQDQSFNSYVAPWAQAQPQPQPQSQSQPQFRPQFQSAAQPQSQPQYHHQFQTPTQAQFQAQAQPQAQSLHQPQSQPHPRPQPQYPQESSLQSQHTSQQLPQSPLQPELNQQPRTQLELHSQPQQLPPRAQTQFPQYSAYPPPPWASTPGYFSNPNHSTRPSYMYSTPQNTSMPLQGPRPVQNVNSIPTMGSNGVAINGDAQIRSSPKTTSSAAGQKPFIPSYRLFEDLNVFGNGDQRHNSSSGVSGTSSQSMVGGRK
ncbi:TOM1-like protein 6 isoform X3 [Nicotiana tabacum]|uniref:TOM1-like protein 6 isoform X3 n=1 Tax=Nicotiana tabacum TaxID=4097 RepID=A0A1S4ADR9_TOBAC|nr:PREDICTED: target of Myb protein 1-like isoform X1 [Nicotiana tabacum]